MFLKEIHLKNFKCHSDLYLNFESLGTRRMPIRKTTFLLGENGTGKSALLKAIALVTGGSATLGDMLGNPVDLVRKGTKAAEISATLMNAELQERKISLRVDLGANLKQIIEQNSESLDLIDRAIEHADRNYFVIGYGASRRLARESSLPGESVRWPRSANIYSLFNPDAQLISLANWAMDLDYTGRGDGLKTVKKSLDQFLVENVKFKSIDRENRRLIFSTPDGDLPLSQLSDGYQNVASWVGDLLFRVNDTFRDFKEPLKARGLLLIDEIDLHLHPRWQRKLHSFLEKKLPNFQVIATTHSPLTAQQTNEGELYALRRVGKKIELTAFRGTPNKMLLHQILMSPVFGLESDESLEVQKTKAKVRETSLKKRKTSADKEFIQKASAELVETTTMNIRKNGLLSDEDLKLLRSINKELGTKK